MLDGTIHVAGERLQVTLELCGLAKDNYERKKSRNGSAGKPQRRHGRATTANSIQHQQYPMQFKKTSTIKLHGI
jgi:hypothetical protein